MLYYQEHGSGKPILLLHSGGMAGEEWQPQIPALAKRYRVIVPDLPGHGRSLLKDEPLTIAMMGQAVIELCDELGIEQAHVCGSSMGGAVALWLALNYPERIKKLVIYRITYRKNQATHAQTQNMSDPGYWRQFGLHKWLSKLHEPQGGVDAWEDVIARVSEALDPETSTHNHQLDDLAQISAPTLLIVGDRDPVAPLDDVLDMYHTIPKAGLWVMPYATHITASNTWRSDAFAEECLRFFAREE
ncbi:alpha/beta hydrolase [Suttonella sp. R2A3]|uniref:alpha/beta fold hydrolase n=1 Tax=Suttonella sp. R2A3 TaxID=2908648 RepID=UPI001F48749D|nr:alpha/beta fold hydrolase [Suttonella sp. R2A3]UJF24701.1 alpha/beta hydrolase [Suttonella sp. R2A3]